MGQRVSKVAELISSGLLNEIDSSKQVGGEKANRGAADDLECVTVW